MHAAELCQLACATTQPIQRGLLLTPSLRGNCDDKLRALHRSETTPPATPSQPPLRNNAASKPRSRQRCRQAGPSNALHRSEAKPPAGSDDVPRSESTPPASSGHSTAPRQRDWALHRSEVTQPQAG